MQKYAFLDICLSDIKNNSNMVIKASLRIHQDLMKPIYQLRRRGLAYSQKNGAQFE